MTFKMDRLRFAIIEKLPSISSLNTAHVSDETRQAFALMALSLNAIADHETLNMMIRMAGLWPETQDPQGDAQLECEEAFADDRPAQPNRAADAPGEHHAQKCGLKKTSPFPLAQ
ncbi:hypothetical protein Z949_1859 [Sulfitobacter guttiformis KCTC 32187]|nr:hypothetical protein Z949_1859 [Sulfitobacter guttiformis KCTC 32187]